MAEHGASRIIAAAMRLVAAKGEKGATVRAVAAEAGVSPSLVIHHFGSKAGLTAAVDEYVVARFEAALRVDPVSGIGPEAIATALSEVIGSDADLRGYLRRSILEGGATGQSMFARLLVLTEAALVAAVGAEKLPEGSERRWLACQILIVNLAATLLAPVLEPVLDDGDLFESKVVARRTSWNLAFIEGGVGARTRRDR